MGVLTFFSMFLMIVAIGLSTQSAHAMVVFATKRTSAKGVDVTFGSQFTISDDILTVILTNDSLVDNLNPNLRTLP